MNSNEIQSESVPNTEHLADSNEKYNVMHYEEMGGNTNLKTESWSQIKVEADAAEAREKQLTLWQSFKMYRSAVGWSLIASLSIIMEGYDTSLA